MRRIKRIARFCFLMALLLLSGIVVSYGQQNTGASPYLDSGHAYRVSIGLVANTQEWVVTDGTTTYNLTDTPQAWATITPATADGGYDVIQIDFDRAVFSVGTWYLQYRELQDMGGSIICTAAREFELTVVENTFHLTLADDVTTQCNSQSGEIHPLSEVVDAGDVYDTDVTYTVTMDKNAAFDPTYWEFDANFSQSIVDISKLTVASSDGTVATSELTAGTDYHIKITPSAPNPDAVTVTLTVTYSNNVLSDVSNSMTVSNGQAVIEAPPAPDAVTDDNESIYPIAAPGDRVQAITILEVPSTQDISFGAGETAATAQSPMLLSTHKYVVVMESVANNASWYIENAAGTYTLVENTDYTLVQNQSATADTATISLINDALATGAYTIYFTEENATTSCSSVRPYPITIMPPFDVDIAAAADLCADIAGVINNSYTTATTTTGSYTVTLETAGYANNWSFDIGVSTNQSFVGTDVDVPAAAISASGGSYTVTDNYSGSVSVAGGTTSVTIEIDYEGFYLNEHDLTLTLTNITGSFAETDADASNTTTHTLKSMPQPLALQGVD